MNSREQMNGIGVLSDVLLSVFGKVSQHVERSDTDGNVISVGPDLDRHQDHTRVQMLLKNLTSHTKTREE